MKFTLFSLLTIFPSFYYIFGQSDYFREKGVNELAPFYHGVASGDPLSDRVILWTRVTNDGSPMDSIEVEWRIATDTSMLNVVNSGSGFTDASSDWTFKVDATGLEPGEWYYYDFRALEKFSLRGRTKTAPIGDVDSLRFGVVSCSNYEHGFFTPYRYLSEKNDVDCILHLGDYIYEYEAGGYSADLGNRTNQPVNEIITLDDYRIRHSHYKLDSDLRFLHQNYPFINIWDDHESANDSYKDGAENHDPGTEGSWIDRKSNSAQAYHEWLPIRSPQPGAERIYRAFEFGDLINLPMVDTRIEGRDEQGGSSETNDPNRSLLGQTQFEWLSDNLKSSSKQWNIIGNQVMIAPLEVFGTPVNYDQWDGYNYERNRLFDTVTTNGIDNFIVLTGDIHTSWVNDIPLDNYDASNCNGSVGVEFVVTSVTSTSFPFNVGTSVIQSMNDHMQYINLDKKGYGILDVSKSRTQFDFYYVDDIEDPNTFQYFAEGYYVNNQENCAQQAAGYSIRENKNPVLAPSKPIHMTNGLEDIDYEQFVIMGAYPNPATDQVTFQVYMKEATDIDLKVFDINGRLIHDDVIVNTFAGVNYIQLGLNTIARGTYSFVFSTKNHIVNKTVIKAK